ncbi:hypothetical protein [Streptomyces sp. NPDC005281]|uniref:hypothetical protein n=1 Tax=Streptomyces sp. NPDC005281 TaxID=3155712 RepID=UPI0033BD6621
MNEQWHQRQHPHAGGPAGALGGPAGSGHAPQPAVLIHELVTMAGTDADTAQECARRLAAALPPRARSVLLNALAEPDPRHHDNADNNDGLDGYGNGGGLDGYGSGGGLCFEGPEYTAPRGRSGLSLLPAYRAPGPDRPAVPGPGDHGPGDHDPGGGLWPEPDSGAPAAVIRLRFAEAITLERAGACFDGAFADPGTGALHIPADAGVETLRAVLAVLDAAALVPESLTVHSNELDDVFAAFTGLL